MERHNYFSPHQYKEEKPPEGELVVRPDNETLLKKRDEYIQEAINDVIKKGHNWREGLFMRDFVYAVQDELHKRSALANQLPQRKENEEAFNSEFRDYDIERVITRMFHLDALDHGKQEEMLFKIVKEESPFISISKIKNIVHPDSI